VSDYRTDPVYARERHAMGFKDVYDWIPFLCDEIERLREENIKLKAKLYDSGARR
jgi:hypothetical protein